MRTRPWMQMMLIVATCCAAEAPTFADAGVAAGVDQDGPRILGGLPPRTRWLLRAAVGWARQRALSPECQSLFHDLAADPQVVLSHAIYTEPGLPSDEVTCRQRRAVAFTTVGPGSTVVCPRFEHLGVNEAAAFLLHEALHNAGQTEWPSDPEAPTSAQIQARVRQQCRL